MNLGFSVTSAKSKRQTEDQPVTQSMRPEARGLVRRAPSTDQKKVRSQLRRKTAGSAWQGGDPVYVRAGVGHQCEYPAPHHSDDLLEVHHGAGTPAYLCGYHEQRMHHDPGMWQDLPKKQGAAPVRMMLDDVANMRKAYGLCTSCGAGPGEVHDPNCQGSATPVTGATAPGFYRDVPHGDGTAGLEWMPPAEIDTRFHDVFPDGVPLHGDLTPDQQRELSRRSALDDETMWVEAAEARDMKCGSCGHTWKTEAQYRLDCPSCGASESVHHVGVSESADGAERYEHTPDPATPGWINDEYTDPSPSVHQLQDTMGGGADSNDNPIPDWEDREGDPLKGMQERQDAQIEEGEGYLGPLWEGKETPPHAAKKGASMTTEAELLNALADPRLSFADQQRVAAHLEQLRGQKVSAAQAARDLDLTAPIEFAHLSSVPIQSLVTHASDWLDEVPDAGVDSEGMSQDMATEGSMWFTARDPAVIEDGEEFVAQAEGMARRLSGRYGEDAPVAYRAFMDTVSRLRKRAINTDTLNASGKPDPTYEVDHQDGEPIYADVITAPPADNKPLDEPVFPKTGPGAWHPGMPGAGQSTANPKRTQVASLGLELAGLQTKIGKQLPPQVRPFVAALSTLGSLDDQVGGVNGRQIAEYVVAGTEGWGGREGFSLRQRIADMLDGTVDSNSMTDPASGGATCEDCNGVGAVPAQGFVDPSQVDNGYMSCPTCGGTGQQGSDAAAGAVPAGSPAGAPATPEQVPPLFTGSFRRTASDDGSTMLKCPECGTEMRGDVGDKCPKDGTVMEDNGPHGKMSALQSYAAYAGRCATAGLVPQPFSVVAGDQPPWLKKDDDDPAKADSGQSADTKSEGGEGGDCKRTTCKHPKGSHADGEGKCSQCDCPKYLNLEPVTDDDSGDDSSGSSESTEGGLLGSPVTAQFRKRVLASVASAQR